MVPLRKASYGSNNSDLNSDENQQFEENQAPTVNKFPLYLFCFAVCSLLVKELELENELLYNCIVKKSAACTKMQKEQEIAVIRYIFQFLIG